MGGGGEQNIYIPIDRSKQNLNYTMTTAVELTYTDEQTHSHAHALARTHTHRLTNLLKDYGTNDCCVFLSISAKMSEQETESKRTNQFDLDDSNGKVNRFI